ncbi:MAG TPA: hypothetical protein V6C97_22290 [Oculatellaceae cyanobacterium]
MKKDIEIKYRKEKEQRDRKEKSDKRRTGEVCGTSNTGLHKEI